MQIGAQAGDVGHRTRVRTTIRPPGPRRRTTVFGVAPLRNRISLRALLFLIAAASLAIMLAIAIGVGFRASQVLRETNSVVEVYDPAADDVATLNLAASDMERGLTLFVLTGRERSLRPYVDGERRSALALESLDGLVGEEPDIAPLLRSAERNRQEWIEQIARPGIQQMRADQKRRAQVTITGPRALVLYDRLVLSTDRLDNEINANRVAGFATLSDLSQRLTNAVILSLVVLIATLFLAGWLLFRWVLMPINDLRRQIRRVARRGEHHTPIEPTGPTELAAVGHDAESMRRQLVSEIDEARSARQALEHRAPLVAAIRRELSMATDPAVPGVRVHGEVRAAEGVLAGDWWDCVAMPSGEAALIITDIAGHGPEAGVAAMWIKHVMALMLASGSGPDEAIGLAARAFTDEVGRFATVAVVCVDPATGRIRWANGGHHPPVIVAADGTSRELSRTGPLLSWLGGPWLVETTRMDRSDSLVAFSDGLIESHDAEGHQLELQGLLQLLQEAGTDGAGTQEVVNRTLAQARARAVDWDRDDVTLVVLSLTHDDDADRPTIPVPRPTPTPVT